MANKLYVLTVATPRADLHRFSYIPFLQDFLRRKDAKFEVVPVVNLDKSPLLSEGEFLETFTQLNKLNLNIFTNDEDPSFSKAARTVYTECAKLVDPKDNNAFMWLEDDWFFDFLYEDVMMKYFNNFFEGELENHNMMLLTTYIYFCGNPSVFREDLFNEIVATWKVNPRNVDPEFIHFEAAKSVQGASSWRQTPSNSILMRDKALFIDGGRSWRRAREIGKRARSKTQETWFSCPDGSTEGEKRNEAN